MQDIKNGVQIVLRLVKYMSTIKYDADLQTKGDPKYVPKSSFK